MPFLCRFPDLCGPAFVDADACEETAARPYRGLLIPAIEKAGMGMMIGPCWKGLLSDPFRRRDLAL